MKVFITGAAGFIGFHLSKRLLESGHTVYGVDNLNDYYDVSLKNDRRAQLQQHENFMFHKLDITDKSALARIYEDSDAEYVVNLAAQAGVRYSLENPQVYIDSNITGFLNVLEMCRAKKPKHLVYASSSSVYGGNTKQPFSTDDNVDHPVSLYAATKKSNELMAHTYSHLFGIPTTGLRFFTVYGPYGRPDMALFLFTKAILEGHPIPVFNYGKMLRDFTYIDDIVDGIVGVMERAPGCGAEKSGSYPPDFSWAPYRVFNIGNNHPVELEDFIGALEEALEMKAIREYLPIQPGDVPATYADIQPLKELCGFEPRIHVEEGIGRFVKWYRSYYGK